MSTCVKTEILQNGQKFNFNHKTEFIYDINTKFSCNIRLTGNKAYNVWFCGFKIIPRLVTRLITRLVTRLVTRLITRLVTLLITWLITVLSHSAKPALSQC